MLVGYGVQVFAHKREEVVTGRKLEPFLGVGDYFKRTFAEQFINFPRFVLSGKYLEALKRS